MDTDIGVRIIGVRIIGVHRIGGLTIIIAARDTFPAIGLSLVA